MTGVVWLVHGQVLRVTPEQLRPATAAERVLGELQNTNHGVLTQVVDSLPKGVPVDLTGRIGPNEENIDEDTIMMGTPDDHRALAWAALMACRTHLSGCAQVTVLPTRSPD